MTRLHHLVTKEKAWNSNEVFQAAEKSGFCGREHIIMRCCHVHRHDIIVDQFNSQWRTKAVGKDQMHRDHRDAEI